MAKITVLKEGKGRNKRINVFLDGDFAFSLEADVLVAERLRVGQELSDGDVAQLNQADERQRAINAATRLLSYRPHSETEIRERLLRRGFEAETVDTVIVRLKEQKLVDDADFARFWKENRDSFRPRSQRMTRLELRRKGVDSTVIEEVVSGVDDSENAYRAALPKARLLKSEEYETFRRRLGEYLRRRGFDYNTVNQTVQKIWQERGS